MTAVPYSEWKVGYRPTLEDWLSAFAGSDASAAVALANSALDAAGTAASQALAAAAAASAATAAASSASTTATTAVGSAAAAQSTAAGAAAAAAAAVSKAGDVLTGPLHLPAVYATGGTAGTEVSIAFGNGNYSGGSAQLTNNLAPGVVQYPTAWSGYGICNQVGGNVFGLFGRADLNVAGVASNEMDSFNNTGINPSNSYPPAIDFGTTDHVGIALTLAGFGTGQSAIGLNVAGPAGAPGFQCGAYFWPACASNYGIFIDATATKGPAAPLMVRSKPTQVAITAQVMGTPAPSAAVLNIEDAAANSLASIRANGDIGNAGLTMGSAGTLYFSLPTVGVTATGGTAGLLPTAPVGYLEVVIGGTVRKIPFYAV